MEGPFKTQARTVIDADFEEAVLEVEELLIRAGFWLDYVSIVGNSRYYKFPKRVGTLRVSDHPRSEYAQDRQTPDNKVLSGVTINHNTKQEHIVALVAEAIGRYLIKSGICK